MKYTNISNVLFFILLLILMSCRNEFNHKSQSISIRPLRDTVGFAQYPWQIDSLISRMYHGVRDWKVASEPGLKLAICPHDDYTYVGRLYPELLKNIKAPVLFLIGVAHRAAAMHIQDSLVFDSYTAWKGPWNNVPVSVAREEVYKELTGKYAIINDSLQKVEHSVEAMIPYLQYFNKGISIIPVLVPSMSPDRLDECGKALAGAIRKVAGKHKWEWGTDYAIVVTTDAVHYGNEDWGGSDFAFYGCDAEGNRRAREHESIIIDSCLTGKLTRARVRLFSKYTLDPVDFRKYKWTWCGRYSVPLALFTSSYLNGDKELTGYLTGYSTSITSPHIPVNDLRMGITAIAKDCHWVGYASLAYW